MDFMHNIIPIVAILSSVALPIGFGMFLGLKSIASKHKERMELIKQGIIPPDQTKPTPNKYRSLRNGILCVGIALGLIIALIISRVMELGEDEAFWVVASGILLFLGLAYVTFYILVKDKKEFDDDAE
ncbi:MAG: hypothetical protein LBS20_08700 [Prevotella sp.]|jgi:hypothetical protein|uniref:DUF6249 domain-containing protein n=2 Tax=Dysgonomonas gadei TaxID=156974 RepID=F5J087_9BACT|nr:MULTISPECIES: DUF6249 domain-containing protein [Dysgonomonas]EGK00965.1 hypothetical protein HMPREF9455_02754 [Dysgonomonas gadei ATCC BAA-286]MDR1715912.1 hypothetical protein [Prevotella sp.]MDR2001965.1 hypothetical protein [Prevotella sp.]HMM02826.1 hypothetical protein [Dysgonomonas sp.]